MDDTCKAFFTDAFFWTGKYEDLLTCSPSAQHFLPTIIEENDEAFCMKLWYMAAQEFLPETYKESDKLVRSEREQKAPKKKVLSTVCSRTGVKLPQRPGRSKCHYYLDYGHCGKGTKCV